MIFDFQIDHMIKNLLKFIKQCSNIKNILLVQIINTIKKKFRDELESHLNIYLNNSKYKIKVLDRQMALIFLQNYFVCQKVT